MRKRGEEVGVSLGQLSLCSKFLTIRAIEQETLSKGKGKKLARLLPCTTPLASAEKCEGLL